MRIVIARSGTLADLAVAPDDDLFWRGFVATCVAARVRVPDGVHVDVHSDIPVGRGLGSSAASVVAGALAANELIGSRLDSGALLEIAVGLEGHPDNVAPSLFGGTVLSVPMADTAFIRRRWRFTTRFDSSSPFRLSSCAPTRRARCFRNRSRSLRPSPRSASRPRWWRVSLRATRCCSLPRSMTYFTFRRAVFSSLATMPSSRPRRRPGVGATLQRIGIYDRRDRNSCHRIEHFGRDARSLDDDRRRVRSVRHGPQSARRDLLTLA